MEPITKVSEYPSDWWKRPKSIEFLCGEFKKSVIGLLISYSTNNESPYQFYTGFLLEQKERLLWMTAGHIIDQIDQILEIGNNNLIMRWFDGCPIDGAESIPINYHSLHKKSWKCMGLDAGVIVISPLEKENILKNDRIKPLNTQAGFQIEPAKIEGYFVVGFPRIYNNYKERPAGINKVLKSIRADYTCIPLEKIPFPVNDLNTDFFDKPEAFYGQLIDKQLDPVDYVHDIKYMSGSPIFSIERTLDDKLLYRLVGIQKKWLPESRRICAEPFDKVIQELNFWIE